MHFETDAGDGFREPGFSKERRLDPQITLGLLTDASGLPLSVTAFEGNRAETATMLPVINAFKATHHLSDVTVVADAGMISEANQVALHAAGLTYILGARIPLLPGVVGEWRDNHRDEAIPDGLVLTQPWPASTSEKARGIPDRMIHYQYRHDRARRTLRGIDEQVAKAQRAVDGHAAVKRNRFIKLSGATKRVNRELEAKARALAGWKGYTTNLTGQPASFVIDAYHQLWRIEKAFRMSKHDLQARPIYHRTRESIEAHLSVVFAAMAVSHWIEHQMSVAMKKYRAEEPRGGRHLLPGLRWAQRLTAIGGRGVPRHCGPDVCHPSVFVSSRGNRMVYQTVHAVFRNLCDGAGIGADAPSRPRIHDLRHTFAIRTLIGWYYAGEDVEARLPVLSTYLGHRDPRWTYWYLSAAPELLALAAARLEAATSGGSR